MPNEASIVQHNTDTFENVHVANTDELQEVLRPIDSLISKSEKAKQKLAMGTWQHNDAARQPQSVTNSICTTEKGN